MLTSEELGTKLVGPPKVPRSMSLYWWCFDLWSGDGFSCAAMPTGMASAANRNTTVIHIHVRDFMFFSSLLRKWRFKLARSGIANKNLRQVHTPERRGRGLAAPPRQEINAEPSLIARSWRLAG